MATPKKPVKKMVKATGAEMQKMTANKNPEMGRKYAKDAMKTMKKK